jgi:glutamyl/glutaminyl-tRNA synthetase
MASITHPVTSEYRGRIAPSPTGFLHVGHARTFWRAYERARNAGGALVFRLEDLDLQRSRKEYVEAAIEDLRWLGIRWQEGPDVEGRFGPYYQSRRRTIYIDAWRRLFRAGLIYPCYCTRKDLEASIGAPHEVLEGKPDAFDDEPIYPGTCRPPIELMAELSETSKPKPEVLEGINWRFRVTDGETVSFHDKNLGAVSFEAGRDFGDFLVWRRDGAPSYQLACVADDAAMGITEVVRGADLLKSTARQILLNRALGFAIPEWYHCPLIVDHNGKRLAKRHDALSLRTLRQRGITPMNILSADLPVAV